MSDLFFELVVDFYKDLQLLGPGSQEQTQKALAVLPLNKIRDVADLGCGTGAQTAVLAEQKHFKITAVDFLKPFFDTISYDNVSTLEGDISQLPFKDESFDLIWSEGAIYNIGFEAGSLYWKKFLRRGGYLAVTEISWLTDSRPDELNEYWNMAYPEINTVDAKIAQLQNNGYRVMEHFTLPKACWVDYYNGVKAQIPLFLEKYKGVSEAEELVEEQRVEINLFDKYSEYYSYVFYIAQKM